MAVPQPYRLDRLQPRERLMVARRVGPAYQAYLLLLFAFTIVPIVAGVDKFFDRLVAWHNYLAPVVTKTIGIDANELLMAVGIVEIVAGLIVAFKPSVGGWIVAAGLWAIIVDLLLVPGYFDVALRDFGLSLGALALAYLARYFEIIGAV